MEPAACAWPRPRQYNLGHLFTTGAAAAGARARNFFDGQGLAVAVHDERHVAPRRRWHAARRLCASVARPAATASTTTTNRQRARLPKATHHSAQGPRSWGRTPSCSGRTSQRQGCRQVTGVYCVLVVRARSCRGVKSDRTALNHQGLKNQLFK
jgi:hypothetical protein